MTNSDVPLMKSATIADAKAHLSSLITAAQTGEDVIITRRGKPVARLIAEPDSRPFDWADLENWVKTGPACHGPSVAELRDQDLL